MKKQEEQKSPVNTELTLVLKKNGKEIVSINFNMVTATESNLNEAFTQIFTKLSKSSDNHTTNNNYYTGANRPLVDTGFHFGPELDADE